VAASGRKRHDSQLQLQCQGVDGQNLTRPGQVRMRAASMESRRSGEDGAISEAIRADSSTPR